MAYGESQDVLIVIGVKILSSVKIGRECILGAGILITGGTVIPPRSLVLGLPGHVVHTLTEEELKSIKVTAERYVRHSEEYRAKS